MPAKPNPSTILQTYDLDEILDLARSKAHQVAEEKVQQLKDNLAQALSHEYFTSSSESQVFSEFHSAPSKEVTKKSQRGRPKRTGKRTAGSKRKSLSQRLQEVIGPEPMKIDEIMHALKKNGYQSNAKDPRRLLYLELGKLVENNVLKKTGWGKYAAV